MAAWKRIDILVNNTGIIGQTAPLWELPVSELDRVYGVNLRGTYIFCQQAVPHMLKNNYGRIVNMASIAGKEGNPNMVPYSATKAAIIGLTKSLGKELAETGIRVNCITPAVVRTPIWEQTTPAQMDMLLARIPMKRSGEIAEVAALAAWLASAECSFSTGAVFDLSGGPRDVLAGGLANALTNTEGGALRRRMFPRRRGTRPRATFLSGQSAPTSKAHNHAQWSIEGAIRFTRLRGPA